MSAAMASLPGPILLIDDDEDHLARLKGETISRLEGLPVEVKVWSPKGYEDAFAIFESLVVPDAALVVTDYDLTGGARTGLYGASIIDWCQSRLIPVAAYTQRIDIIAEEPNPFEFRLSLEPATAAREAVAIVRGFRAIALTLVGDPTLMTIPSPTAVLAALVGHPEATASFSLYGTRASSSNPGLVETIRGISHPSLEQRSRVLTYVAGHLLYNSVLKYPGPLMSSDALCAYLALPPSAAGEVAKLFVMAKYSGPFNELGTYYWLTGVDQQLEEIARRNQVDYDDMTDIERRAVVEAEIGHTLGRHNCARCSGERGGFWCPFEKRPVCERSDCSVGSSNLIPQGAGLTRIERDYYDAWVPLLGI